MMLFEPKSTLRTLRAQIERGDTTSRELTEIALHRIESAGGHGDHTYTFVDAVGARAQADAADALRRAGNVLSPLMGLPLSVKDLFDIAGQVTCAGSQALTGAAPATADAPSVARLRRAGAVLIGRTNMSEFAYSGLGLNPHYGNPSSPWRSDVGHVTGGSSSGAAASVGKGMAAAALGTDTGGSVRIPAAYCGLAAFKPTARRVPREGGVPLSTSLDSFGPIAPSVGCCIDVDRVLSDELKDIVALQPVRPISSLRLGVLTTLVNDQLDPVVAAAYHAALEALSRAGAQLVDVAFSELSELPAINRYGFSAIEAAAWHRELMAREAERYDPRVLAKIRAGATASAADYLDLLAARSAMIDAAQRTFASFDAILAPTVPNLPALIADVEHDDAAFIAENQRAIRNTAFVNFIDGCALSIPLPAEDDAPVGLMLAGLSMQDHAVLSVGLTIEAVVRG